jgi:hypothetical protein
MAISLSGLDLSFMRANPLPKQRGRPKKKVSFTHLRSNVASPRFMSDIAPFVNVASADFHEITSRSQLRAFERSSGMRQVGNDFEPGSIAKANENKKAEWQRLAKTVDHGWTDFDG